MASFDKIFGCLIGGAIGDALGAPVEFDLWPAIAAQHGPHGVIGYLPAYGGIGCVTDDTQLTLIASEAIARSCLSGSSPDREAYALYHPWSLDQLGRSAPIEPWLAERPVLRQRRAPGNTCLSGFSAGKASTAEPVNTHSKGCGTVMRAAPFGLVEGWPAEIAYELAVADAALSHGHPTAWAASGTMAAIIRHLLGGTGLRPAVERALGHLPDHQELAVALREAIDAADAPERGVHVVESLGKGWVADEALAIAVYCALAYEQDPPAALLAAVNHSGDSDSTGSLTGQLIGAAHGASVFPESWRAENEAAHLVAEAAEALPDSSQWAD